MIYMECITGKKSKINKQKNYDFKNLLKNCEKVLKKYSRYLFTDVFER